MLVQNDSESLVNSNLTSRSLVIDCHLLDELYLSVDAEVDQVAAHTANVSTICQSNYCKFLTFCSCNTFSRTTNDVLSTSTYIISAKHRKIATISGKMLWQSKMTSCSVIYVGNTPESWGNSDSVIANVISSARTINANIATQVRHDLDEAGAVKVKHRTPQPKYTTIISVNSFNSSCRGSKSILFSPNLLYTCRCVSSSNTYIIISIHITTKNITRTSYSHIRGIIATATTKSL